MNRISFKFVSFLLGLTALTVVSSSISARAEMPRKHLSIEHESSASVQPVETNQSLATVDPVATNSTSSQPAESSTASAQPVAPAVNPNTTTAPLATNTSIPEIAKDTAGQVNVQQANLADLNNYQTDSQRVQPEALPNDQQTPSNKTTGTAVATPIPGTVETSAASLDTTPGTAPLSRVPSKPSDDTVAQTNTNTTVEPGRATRGGSSYIGVGGNIGLGGGSALGDGAFAVTSKIGLTRTFSFRPAAIIGDETAFLLPVTYDFVIQSSDPFAPVPFAPYLGGGAAITTEGDVGFLLTGGVDVPLSRQFVANGAINVDFGDDTNVGLFLGIGYTFPSLFQR